MKLLSVSNRLLAVVVSAAGLLTAQASSTNAVILTRETQNTSACNICPANSEIARDQVMKAAGLVSDVAETSSGTLGSVIYRETGTRGKDRQSSEKQVAIVRETSRNEKALAPIKIDLVSLRGRAGTSVKPSAKTHTVDINITSQIDAKFLNITVEASDGLSIVGKNQRLEQQVSWSLESLKNAINSKVLTVSETGRGDHRLFVTATVVTTDDKRATKVDSFLVDSQPSKIGKPRSQLVVGANDQVIQEVPAQMMPDQ
jgi:hypothetical protein